MVVSNGAYIGLVEFNIWVCGDVYVALIWVWVDMVLFSPTAMYAKRCLKLLLDLQVKAWQLGVSKNQRPQCRLHMVGLLLQEHP